MADRHRKPLGRGASKKMKSMHSHKDEHDMFLHSIADMNVVKSDLQNLMSDFKRGNLNAIGTEKTRNQMDKIQVMQNKLALLHFELDEEINYSVLGKNLNTPTEEITKKQNENMVVLMHDLEGLSSAIKSLDTQTLNRSSKKLNPTA